jgi:hypothetical protein
VLSDPRNLVEVGTMAGQSDSSQNHREVIAAWLKMEKKENKHPSFFLPLIHQSPSNAFHLSDPTGLQLTKRAQKDNTAPQQDQAEQGKSKKWI